MNNVDLNTYEDGSMPSLDIGKLLDQIPEQEKENFLTLCCKKLSYGGNFKLRGIHLDSFCKEYLFGANIDPSAIFQLQSVTNLGILKQSLEQKGLTIVSININGGIYSIEASK